MVKKQDKVYDEFEIEWSLNGTSRKELRDAAVQKFLEEKGGYWEKGIKHVTRFKYFVEQINDGRRVFLLRPTFLNKGIDFQVWVERMEGIEDKRPSHKNIFEDLELKKEENPKEFIQLVKAIDRVCSCEEPEDILKEIKLNFQKGFPPELLLKILKWLFIEQDITYWNYDGRTMLRMAIDEKFSSS